MTTDGHERTAGEERARNAIRDLPPVAPDPEFRERLGRAFVAGELTEREGGAAGAVAGEGRGKIVPLRRAMAVLAAAAAVVVFLWFANRPGEPEWVVLPSSATGTLVEAGEETWLGDLAAGGRGVEAGATVRVDQGSLALLAGDVLAMRVSPETALILPDPTSDGPIEIDIPRGEALFLTGPGFPGRRLHVSTPEGRVVVTGTAFAVWRSDEATCVCVLEGEASVGIDEADLESVSPGLRKVMFADGRPSEILDVAPEHRDGLLDFVERVRGVLGE